MASGKSSSLDVKKADTSEKVPFILCSERWRLAFIAFVGFFFVYSLRVNMSVAIVCMVKADNSTNTTTDNSTCGTSDSSSSSKEQGEFDWNKGIQSSILSSFFYGYLVMQIPGGWLAGKFGGKRVLGISMTIVAVATVLLPELARRDYKYVYGLRVIMGIASSVSFPAMHAMWGRWAPPAERSRLASFTYTGLMVGNIVTFICSGYLCAHGFDHGWGSVFYVSGGACFVWLALWWLLVSDSPDQCSRITEAERNYIVNGIGDNPHAVFKVPWKEVAKSKAMWVVLAAHMCNNWMHYTLVTSLPTFMKEVLHYDIEQNGVLSAIPYMAMAVTATLGGHVADFVSARCLSTRATRRVFQATSFLGAGACLVAVGFVDCEQRTTAVILLGVAVGFEGLCYSGYMVNQIDFAPRYAGVLFGITNFISTIPGIVAPEVAGLLTPNKTQEEWRSVFYVCGAFTLFGAVVFGAFAVTDVEPWAKVPDVAVDDVKNLEIQVVAETGTKNGVIAYDNKGMNTSDVVDNDAVDTRL
ncbi:sialin-like [Littorina saxatilis]|uniref:Sialin n=1 Tax=Littorina saxatilis TaxID=31220 RepID=A0AAN9G2R8_9CAEN